ncbi:hypothetical protein [Amycolatopsis sp. H20-H5]|uniref:hypothetical protein n=1 Tax=Amycolatopsis sp. H20-H5 TaxID=3046309 RepID=UPI002DBA27DB|nr:hypothetical protein [Amycolatopsis sp. H20-H5]MEC3982175.1 hypothetical protein [Amycolatopsis sp. H20-H5]
MNEEYARMVRRWLDPEPAVPVQRDELDDAWQACARHAEEPVFALIPAPRCAPEQW